VAGPVGSSIGVLTGVAVGGAATVALQPAFEVPRQDAWSRNAHRILDVGLLARLVAQGGVDLGSATDEAARDGFGPDKLDALIYLEQTVPGFAEALNLWRRGLISNGDFSHVLVKAGLDQRYAAPLMALKEAEIVGIGDIAYGIVRGILPAPGYVPVAPPTSGTSVPRFPQINVDPEALAAKLGFDPQMLQLMVGRSGLSLAPGLAATALFRGLINENDFLLAIAEGDLRTEWATTLRDATRQILTAGEYAQLELRGFIDAPTRRTLTQQHGMSNADSDRLENVLGRAPGVHAITTGLARGATYPSDYSAIPEPYKAAIQRSDIRPEFADIVYHDRYTYPSAFVLRSLAQAGDLGGQAAVEQVLLEIGWKPSFATQVSTAWTQGSTTGDPHTSKAQTQLWSATHRSYVGEMIDDATATAALAAAGVAAAAVPAILALWKEERSLIRKQLSPAQIKKAYKDGIFTQAQASSELLARGYDQADATVLLEE